MKIIFLLILMIANSCIGQVQESLEAIKKRQESLIEEYLVKGAQTYNYEYQMAEWQKCLDEGLKKDSTVARFWQEKAMPYFKAKKYEIGMEYVDKAVFYDRKEYLSYRAFIKCIFSKQYRASIKDFEDAKKEFGNQYVMDHTYNFYIAISYLQLNEYEKADALLKDYTEAMFKKNGEAWVNPTALFYYGIAKYELKEYNEAIKIFDRALALYEHFSDVKFYKAVCLARLGGNQEDIKKLIKESKEDAKLGYTIGEYNTVYETYPYQKKWHD
jgi:tetratricopeptide (TPR) repeat protein